MTRAAGVAGLAIAALLLTGCTQASGEPSRAKLYDSIFELSADSSLVVVGKVSDQNVADGSPAPQTISTIEVFERFSPEGLGRDLPKEAPPASDSLTLHIRQPGTTDMDFLPAPILKKGESYLLFLAPTMLEGDVGDDFFITGGQPGFFTVEGDSFTRVVTDTDDKLPRKISEGDLQGSRR